MNFSNKTSNLISLTFIMLFKADGQKNYLI